MTLQKQLTGVTTDISQKGLFWTIAVFSSGTVTNKKKPNNPPSPDVKRVWDSGVSENSYKQASNQEWMKEN